MWGEGERRLVVVTGGEPMLQLDEALIEALHDARLSTWRWKATGRLAAPAGIDWLCISPKAGTEVVQRSGNELKLVWPQDGIDPEAARALGLRPFPGPADGLRRGKGRDGRGDWPGNGRPLWRLSLQAHKVVGLP